MTREEEEEEEDETDEEKEWREGKRRGGPRDGGRPFFTSRESNLK